MEVEGQVLDAVVAGCADSRAEPSEIVLQPCIDSMDKLK